MTVGQSILKSAKGQALTEAVSAIPIILMFTALVGFLAYRGYLYFRYREEVYESLICVEKTKSKNKCMIIHNLRLYRIPFDQQLILLRISQVDKNLYRAKLNAFHTWGICTDLEILRFVRSTNLCQIKLEMEVRLPLYKLLDQKKAPSS